MSLFSVPTLRDKLPPWVTASPRLSLSLLKESYPIRQDVISIPHAGKLQIWTERLLRVAPNRKRSYEKERSKVCFTWMCTHTHTAKACVCVARSTCGKRPRQKKPSKEMENTKEWLSKRQRLEEKPSKLVPSRRLRSAKLMTKFD